MSLSSAGLGLASVRSGWMMLAVLRVIHAFSPVQAGELDLTTVTILKMWPFTVMVLVLLLPESAALLSGSQPLHGPQV